MELLLRPKTAKKKDVPEVGKFMMDIYRDIYYSDSALADYVTSFYTGYRFSDY